MEKMTSLNNSGAILNANAKQAHEVAEFLHKFGFPAYVLHTEFTSYVTIGGFDAAGDPKLMQAQQAFVAEINNPKSNVGQMNVRGRRAILQAADADGRAADQVVAFEPAAPSEGIIP